MRIKYENFWFYVNKITNFFKDLFSLKDKK